MYAVSLIVHSLVRWIVIVAGLAAVLRAFGRWSGRAPWGEAEVRAGRLFVMSLDLQGLIGLTIYLFISPITTGAFRNRITLDYPGLFGLPTMSPKASGASGSFHLDQVVTCGCGVVFAPPVPGPLQPAASAVVEAQSVAIEEAIDSPLPASVRRKIGVSTSAPSCAASCASRSRSL